MGRKNGATDMTLLDVLTDQDLSPVVLAFLPCNDILAFRSACRVAHRDVRITTVRQVVVHAHHVRPAWVAHLRVLHLDRHVWPAHRWESLVQSLSVRVRDVVFMDCNIDPDVVLKLPASLERLSLDGVFGFLDVWSNRVTQAWMRSALHRFKALRALSLARNDLFFSRDTAHLLLSHAHLRELDVRQNHNFPGPDTPPHHRLTSLAFTIEDMEHAKAILVAGRDLESLTLVSDWHIRYPILRLLSIPGVLTPSLRELRLSGGSFFVDRGGWAEACQVLTNVLKSLPCLQVLDLNNSAISADIFHVLWNHVPPTMSHIRVGMCLPATKTCDIALRTFPRVLRSFHAWWNIPEPCLLDIHGLVELDLSFVGHHTSPLRLTEALRRNAGSLERIVMDNTTVDEGEAMTLGRMLASGELRRLGAFEARGWSSRQMEQLLGGIEQEENPLHLATWAMEPSRLTNAPVRERWHRHLQRCIRLETVELRRPAPCPFWNGLSHTVRVWDLSTATLQSDDVQTMLKSLSVDACPNLVEWRLDYNAMINDRAWDTLSQEWSKRSLTARRRFKILSMRDTRVTDVGLHTILVSMGQLSTRLRRVVALALDADVRRLCGVLRNVTSRQDVAFLPNEIQVPAMVRSRVCMHLQIKMGARDCVLTSQEVI